MAVKQYVGARYVPKFADPYDWQKSTSYEPLTIVQYNNSSYTSKKAVPADVGNPADNKEYWVLTGNYNGQVEQYRQDVVSYKGDTDTQLGEVNTKIDSVQSSLLTKLTSSFVTVDINGNGDFVSITQAMEASDKKTIKIFLMNGTYHEWLDFSSYDDVTIIGESKNAIIYYDSGIYKNPTLNMNQKFDIENISIMALYNNSFTPTFNDSDVLNTYPSYALHIDTYQNTNLSGYVINCDLYSTSGPCVGVGSSQSNKIVFENCTMKRVAPTHYRANDSVHDGAFLAHNSNEQGATQQLLIMSNNYIECNYAPSAVYRFDIESSTGGATLQLLNNTYILTESSYNNKIYYTQGQSTLIGKDNNVYELNNQISSKYCDDLFAAALVNNEYTFEKPFYLNAKYLFVSLRKSADYSSGGSIMIPIDAIISQGFNVDEVSFLFPIWKSTTEVSYAQVLCTSTNFTVKAIVPNDIYNVAQCHLIY